MIDKYVPILFINAGKSYYFIIIIIIFYIYISQKINIDLLLCIWLWWIFFVKNAQFFSIMILKEILIVIFWTLII